MKKITILLSAVLAVCLLAPAVYAKGSKNLKKGEELFKQHCAICHPDGGNIINPAKTLHKKDLSANNVKSAGDIVSKMRNPGEGMTKFDKTAVPDADAKEIAEYILKTFK
ncbi:MAG: c-type cytochrome [Nitrospirae bacterium]|nr:c-type cytochrome [Nitrospirota bacterium]